MGPLEMAKKAGCCRWMCYVTSFHVIAKCFNLTERRVHVSVVFGILLMCSTGLAILWGLADLAHNDQLASSQPIDETPLAILLSPAFPNLRWTGWESETARGLPNPLKPVVLTHAGDGAKRVFVATQEGIIHVFSNDPETRMTRVFLDISSRVRCGANAVEEGLLGLAFHPHHKTNGYFFVFYTTKHSAHKHTNVLSKFRVFESDAFCADPSSEEELLRIERPFPNHNGGTICFGPDGYLYVATGDGGGDGDPYGNAQDLGTLFGKILRIDINRKSSAKGYAIPDDNPFVQRIGARPETWAYGLRNVWRMAFDRHTNTLWAADVGQDRYEEINIIVRGGNYGWNLREGCHPFSNGSLEPEELIDPLWEYSHDVGRCIIGGGVYRGKRLPELSGAYLYGDYVTGRICALYYDKERQRVVANRPIKTLAFPLLSFGEDDQGEWYCLTKSATGKAIWQFEPMGEKSAHCYGACGAAVKPINEGFATRSVD